MAVQTIGKRQQLTTPVLVGRHRPLGQLPPRPGVDSHRGVRAHMRVDPDHDHQPLLPRSTSTNTDGRRTAHRQGHQTAARLLSSHTSDPPTRRAT